MERSKSLHGAAAVPEPPPRPSRLSLLPDAALAEMSLGPGSAPGPGGSPKSRSASLLPNTKLPETLPSARRGFLQRGSAIEEAGAPAPPPPRLSIVPPEDAEKGYVEANPAMFARGFSSRSGSSTSVTSSTLPLAASTAAPTPLPPPRLSMLPQEDLDKGYVEANPAMFARGFSSRAGSSTSLTATLTPSAASSAPGHASSNGSASTPAPSPRPSVAKISENEDHAYEYQDALAQPSAKANKALNRQITFDLEDTSCLGEPWYHGELSRVDAEERLRKNGFEEGLFLVRNSSHGSASLAISVCHGGKILHHRLEMTQDRQYMFVGNIRRFRSLALLIDFYVKTPDEEKYRLKRYLNARIAK